MKDICAIYLRATEADAQGERTICLDEMTGIQAHVGQTRTEADYLAHVQQTLATDPETKKWHLIMDCLNIHQSESWLTDKTLNAGG